MICWEGYELRRDIVKFLTSLIATVGLVVTIGCGGDDGDILVQGGASSSNATGPLARASAEVTLRVSPAIPGAQPVAVGSSTTWNPLMWFSSPAYAQAFFTLPGARVDLVGDGGFALADSQGVARFYGLNPGMARFAVSTSNPGTILQTLVSLRSGQTVNPRLDEYTSMGAILASTAATALGTEPAGSDLDVLAREFEHSTQPEFVAVREQVLERLSGPAVWLDLTSFLPTETALENSFKSLNQAVSYRVSQVPLEGQAVPTEPIILSVTFNNPIDPTTLPGLGATGWSLTTPSGSVLNQTNFQASGVTVAYSGAQGSGGDGRAYPPNTLTFRIPGASLPAGTPLQYKLSLSSLPRDTSGREVLSSRPASTFTEWNFVAYGPGIPGAMVESNVTGNLDFLGSTCEGSTNATLTNFGAPQLVLGRFDLGNFTFDYYEAPSLQRVFQVRLKASTPIQVGSTFVVNADSPELQVLYEERLGTGDRYFRAREGTVTIVSIRNKSVTAVADVVMEPYSHDSVTMHGSGSFCLQAEMTTTFP